MKEVPVGPKATTRPYRSDLRRARADATREGIVVAAYELLRTTRPVDLSFADVAERAGVSVRTVYRYFPAADDLFAAVSEHLFGDAIPASGRETSLADLVAALGENFAQLDEDPALFRIMFAVPSRSRVDQPNTFARVFASYLKGVSTRDRRALFALIDLMSSPYAWDVMHHNWDMPAERSTRAVLVGVQAVLDYVAAHPDALSPKSPPPPLARSGEDDDDCFRSR